MTPCTVRRYAPSDWASVAALLDSWAFKPLAGHARWPVSRLTALCLARAANTLRRSDTATWVAQSSSGVLGLASFSVLPWDTEQIGLTAARLNYLVAAGACAEQRQVKRAMLASVLGYAADHGIEHLSVRLDASDQSGIHIVEECGFVTVDGILTFALKLDGIQFAEPNAGLCIRLATVADSERAADLAREAYVYDRFHTDPAIPTQRADGLYANWLRNSCTGKAADAVFLVEDDEDLLGFVTCKLEPDTKLHLGETLGTIVLVATAERARRRGVASAATRAALNWFYEQGVAIVEVGTQLRNIPASRLYESNGFRLVGSSVSLRKLL